MNMQLTNLTTNFLHCLPFCLCVRPIVGPFVCLCVPVYLYVHLPVFSCVSLYLSVCLCLCVRLFVCVYVCLSLSVCVSVCAAPWQSLCLYSSVFLYFYFLCLSLSFSFGFSLFLYTSPYLDQLLLNRLDECNHYCSQTSRLVLILIAKLVVPNLYCINQYY